MKDVTRGLGWVKQEFWCGCLLKSGYVKHPGRSKVTLNRTSGRQTERMEATHDFFSGGFSNSVAW
jgi:hypothetical protein